MKHKIALSLAVLGVLSLSGCVTVPVGPSVMAMPGTGKTFEQFRYDDAVCRQYAYEQAGGPDVNQSATNAAVGSAVAGTAIGAAAGAAIGGSRGAAVGAGTGLAVGSMAGMDAAGMSAGYSQRVYDQAYIQCMYAKGNQVPVRGRIMQNRPMTPYYPPPPPAGYAPPGGYPPPGGYAPPEGYEPPPYYYPPSDDD